MIWQTKKKRESVTDVINVAVYGSTMMELGIMKVLHSNTCVTISIIVHELQIYAKIERAKNPIFKREETWNLMETFRLFQPTHLYNFTIVLWINMRKHGTQLDTFRFYVYKRLIIKIWIF